TNFTQKPRVFMRTFGHFDVFVGGVAVRFSSSKAKELLALLVDRQGGVVSMQQAISTLWPERKYDDSVRSLYRNVLQSLREALQEAEISEVFVNSRNSRSVNITTFECDLYQLLDGKARGITSFNGEYMVDYLWAEPTIELIKEKIADKRAH
ncbi:MAG: response regulator, partial [Oscillospiraceae bacterium]